MSSRTPRAMKSRAANGSPSKRRRRSRTEQNRKSKGTDLRGLAGEQHQDVSTSASDTASGSQSTLYDAVAGRVSYKGFIFDGHEKPAAPDEVLFRRRNAPVRHEENDLYFAHRLLSPDAKLPDSDLLKTIHAYVSDFYASGRLGNTGSDYLSMDETALLAIGILIEEACSQTLGKTGDLAFVSGEKVQRKRETWKLDASLKLGMR